MNPFKRSRDIEGSVVVITGASSGIGRAAALEFAQRGARVVLAARRSDALQQLARECEGHSAEALVVPTDVRDGEAVEELARQAVERFGRIDTWVNNAAVSMFGRFEESPADLEREVIETNLFGYLHGARAALKRFREQGEGVLINVSSVVAETGQPYTTAYTTTKWAIRGFSRSLEMELSLEGPHDIHVCTVLPAAIDTPLFQQAANYSGRGVKPMEPTYDARMVAETIVKLAQHPKREVHAGAIGRLAPLTRVIPGLGERGIAKMVERDHFDDRSVGPTEGNVRDPQTGWTTIDGGWREPQGSNGNGRGPLAALVALPVAVGSGALALGRLRRRRERRRFPVRIRR